MTKVDWTKPLQLTRGGRYGVATCHYVGKTPEGHVVVSYGLGEYATLNSSTGIGELITHWYVTNPKEPWEQAYATYPSCNPTLFREVFELGRNWK